MCKLALFLIQLHVGGRIHILNYLSIKPILLKLNCMVRCLIYRCSVKADGNAWSLLCCQGCKLCHVLRGCTLSVWKCQLEEDSFIFQVCFKEEKTQTTVCMYCLEPSHQLIFRCTGGRSPLYQGLHPFSLSGHQRLPAASLATCICRGLGSRDTVLCRASAGLRSGDPAADGAPACAVATARGLAGQENLDLKPAVFGVTSLLGVLPQTACF